MPLGAYTIKISVSGFKATVVNNVPVTAGVIYTLPVKLSVQATGETVEVSASGLALDTTSPRRRPTFPRPTVQDIPLNGRDFTQMIGLAPGFAGYALGGFGSVNGTRGNQVNWQIDGSDNNDWWHNIPAVNQGGVENIAGVTLPIDSIEEFSLQTQSSAEVGRNPGGSVNLVTKSGTNTIHGSVYYYERNQALAVTQPIQYAGRFASRKCAMGCFAGRPILEGSHFLVHQLREAEVQHRDRQLGPRAECVLPGRRMQLLSDAGVAVDPATQKLLPILWPADLLAGTTPGSLPVGSARIRLQLQRRRQDRSHLQLRSTASTLALSSARATRRPRSGQPTSIPTSLRSAHPRLQLLGWRTTG